MPAPAALIADQLRTEAAVPALAKDGNETMAVHLRKRYHASCHRSLDVVFIAEQRTSGLRSSDDGSQAYVERQRRADHAALPQVPAAAA